MNIRKAFALLSSLVILVGMIGVIPATAAGPTPPPHPFGRGYRYILVAKSSADYDQLRADAIGRGATVVEELRQANTLVVSAPNDLRSQLAASSHVQSVGTDGIRYLIQPQLAQEMGFKASPSLDRQDLGFGGKISKVKPDPAFSLPGLMWDFSRIGAPQAWKVNAGDPSVLVGVADTGLDYTHSELASQVVDVEDFTTTEDPPLCSTYFGYSDSDFATMFGGPATTDWNGHGSWIGGNIAAAMDGVGINGIAPNVKLVALKISQWCGYAYDSSILDAFYYAADHGIDVVSISFGGYLDRTDPDQDAIYQDYVNAVAYARSKGTVIVAAAGNEHLRIGAGGQVLNHGPLTTPGTAPSDFVDYFGLWETPGGIPGVVDVSATGDVVNPPSRNCDPGTIGSPADSEATCKPKSDAHQPFGVGRQNQLAYYSNYGPRIDVAAPGGARKFNLPTWDRGGTEGFPYVSTDGTNSWEDFSITSNWALEIPCFINIGPQFYANECYTSIQGTSMATPHASAVLALIASSNPKARHHPALLIGILKASALNVHGNATPGLSASDTSAADRTGDDCPTGYCHLGGRPISDLEAYGAGLVNALTAVVFGGH
ncbi:MAG TPA: S8 family serine peptidase [Anaerolineales bacterium]|nr:S8 family serine peptidase [Anaerolineales bacterium]